MMSGGSLWTGAVEITVAATVITLATAAVLSASQTRDMVAIPAGPALLGGENRHSMIGLQPYDVPAFLIDRFEVTNAQYRAFVRATGSHPAAFAGEPELDQDDQPVTGVTWPEARAYCDWSGKRLPTEVEWEKAARGSDGQLYPWGDTFDAALAHLDGSAPVSVAAHPQDISPYGARAMAGNVSEWVADTRVAQAGVCGAPHDHGDGADADPDPVYLAELALLYGTTQIDICRNPDIPQDFAPLETCAFIKGNSWSGRAHMTLSSNRMWDYATSYAEFVGFRCAASPQGEN